MHRNVSPAAFTLTARNVLIMEHLDLHNVSMMFEPTHTNDVTISSALVVGSKGDYGFSCDLHPYRILLNPVLSNCEWNARFEWHNEHGRQVKSGRRPKTRLPFPTFQQTELRRWMRADNPRRWFHFCEIVQRPARLSGSAVIVNHGTVGLLRGVAAYRRARLFNGLVIQIQ
jgi:hypothetical protein